jgi:hypothetical protein
MCIGIVLALVTQPAVSATYAQLPKDASSRNYIANAAPLQPTPMIKLPVSAIRPDGWLAEMLDRQANGLTGELPTISAWLSKEGNAWFSPTGSGRSGWEEVPYWLRGAISLAHIRRDRKLTAECNVWIEAALKNQRSNGDFGPDIRLDDGSRDLWGNMLMLQALQTHYEATEDKRVIRLMQRYFRFLSTIPEIQFLTGYWQNRRGGDQLASIYWLYNRTKEKWLLELAEKNHRRTANWMMSRTLPDWHNVNVAESFDEPGIYYQQSGKEAHLRFAYENFKIIRDLYGDVPGGMFGADENARPGHRDPRQAIETCGMVEQMLSDEELLRITGDSFWADHCEDVAFNSYPAAVTEDFRALRYLTAPNMVASDRENHAPGYQNGGPMTLMNPLSHRCCQHNHTHGWPYYVENLWLATQDNGLATGMYSASRVNARVANRQLIKITQKTRYPFDEQIEFEFETAKPVSFPLYLRIPGWCSNPSIRVNGRAVILHGNRSGYVKLTTTWKRGDRITLSIPMALRARTWEKNHDSVSVQHGPLTFALRITENREQVPSESTALSDSRWQGSLDLSQWPSTEIRAESKWSFGLVETSRLISSATVERRPWPASNYPWSLNDVPIQLKVTARAVPEWQLDRFGLPAPLQASPVQTQAPEETITMVPMGAARLRISAFPVAATNGTSWLAPKPVLPYNPTASHVFSGDDILALCDQIEPKSSSDDSIPRQTWWPRTGSAEWVAYNLKEPRTVSGVEVYWFDDTGKGRCRIPASWTVDIRTGDELRTIASVGSPAKDRFDSVRFNPVTVSEIRLVAQLKPGFSAGVLEWKLIP